MRIIDSLIIVITYAHLALLMVSYHADTDFCDQLINKLERRDKPDQILHTIADKNSFFKFLNYFLWILVVLFLITGGYSWS